jgi:hypothetical protein
VGCERGCQLFELLLMPCAAVQQLPHVRREAYDWTVGGEGGEMFWFHFVTIGGSVLSLTRFRRTSDGEVIRGPEQGFDFVASTVFIFSADLKSYLSHPLNMHFPITQLRRLVIKSNIV